MGIKITRPTVYTTGRDASLIKFIGSILNNLIITSSKDEEVDIPNILICPIINNSENDLELIITTEEKREELLKHGEKCAEEFLECRMKELTE